MAGEAVFRCAIPLMAADTPSHFICRRSRRLRHLSDLAMAIGAFESGAQMHLVREMDKIGKALKPHPRNRLLLVPVGQKLVDLRCFVLERFVTHHADVDGRDRCSRGNICPAMTKKTVDLQLPCVNLMAEGDRLSILPPQIGASLGVEEADYQRDDNDSQRQQRSGPSPQYQRHSEILD